jgi:hypothetical protein
MVNDAQPPAGNDGDGYLGALDFGDERGDDSIEALQFGDEFSDDNRDLSAIDVLGTNTPVEPADTETQAAIRALSEDSVETEDTGDQGNSRELAMVTNPQQTVSVTAIMSGEIQKIELSPTVVRMMTASELADEILVIANLAVQQAQATQYAVMLDSLHATGATDDEALGEILEKHMGLSSPKQAAGALAEVFATRYASADD